MLCLRKIVVAKKFMDKRGGEGSGREYHNFLSRIFCLTVPKNFAGETLLCCVSKSFW